MRVWRFLSVARAGHSVRHCGVASECLSLVRCICVNAISRVCGVRDVRCVQCRKFLGICVSEKCDLYDVSMRVMRVTFVMSLMCQCVRCSMYDICDDVCDA